jgi:ADP-heptose:LPS heptosyltransferase
LFSRNALLKNLDATAGALACRIAGHITYCRKREIYLDDVAANDVKRILVIRPGGLGDMLLLLPVLQSLETAFPGADIDLVCEKRNRAVLGLQGFRGRALCYDGNPLRFITSLCLTRYDLVLDSEQFHNFSAVFGWLSGAPRRVGFNINPRRNPLYTHLVPYSPDGSESDQFAALLSRVTDVPPPPLHGFLHEQLLSPPEAGELPWIAIHTGSGADFKCWGESRTLELARRLIEQTDRQLVFVGSGEEQKAGRRIAAQLPDSRARGLPGRTPPLDITARAIASSALFIGADSGLAHLATAAGVPSVVLFGPSNDRKWGHPNNGSHVVTHGVPCRPCCIFGYHKPCHRVLCMRGIRVDDVVAAALAALDDSPIGE